MEWQKIDTAPKDGTQVLGFWSYLDQDGTSKVEGVGLVEWDSTLPNFPWVSSEGFHPADFISHWMPLPPPPGTPEPSPVIADDGPEGVG